MTQLVEHLRRFRDKLLDSDATVVVSIDGYRARNRTDRLNATVNSLVEVVLAPSITNPIIQANDQHVNHALQRAVRSVQTEMCHLGSINLGDVSIKIIIEVKGWREIVRDSIVRSYVDIGM